MPDLRYGHYIDGKYYCWDMKSRELFKVILEPVEDIAVYKQYLAAVMRQDIGGA